MHEIRRIVSLAERERIKEQWRAGKARKGEEMANEGLNKVMLIGSLGMDPELKHTQSGTALLRIRMATTERYKPASGEWQDRTEWHTVIVWAARAEGLGKVLRKGSKIYVEGRMQTRQWEAQDGGKRSSTEVVAHQVLLLGDGRGHAQGEQRSGGYGGGSQKKSGGRPAEDFPAEEFGDDDVPF